MSRSGYTEEDDSDNANWQYIRYRGRVASAMRGKRGQAFLKELLAALDAMPVKKLIVGELARAGEYCTLGVIGHARGLPLDSVDPDDMPRVASMFGIAEVMVREIVYYNDEYFDWWSKCTPEERWTKMRSWVYEQIRGPKQ